MNENNDETTELVSGETFKSPPEWKFEKCTWQQRYCILCKTSKKDIERKSGGSIKNALRRIRSGSGSDSGRTTPDGGGSTTTTTDGLEDRNKNNHKQRLVFTYYDTKNREKQKGHFIFDGAQITKESNIHSFPYAIKIKLSTIHQNRTLYLCHQENDQQEHEKWWTALNKALNDSDVTNNENEDDDDAIIFTEPEVFQPDLENPILKNLEESRRKIAEERQMSTLYGSPPQTFNNPDIIRADSGISQCSKTSSYYSMSGDK